MTPMMKKKVIKTDVPSFRIIMKILSMNVIPPALNASDSDLPAINSPATAPIIIPAIIPAGGKKNIPKTIPAKEPHTPEREIPKYFPA